MANNQSDHLLVRHYFGDTPKSNVSFEEKRQQAHREAAHNFKTRASRMLSEMGFSVTDVPIELIIGSQKPLNEE